MHNPSKIKFNNKENAKRLIVAFLDKSGNQYKIRLIGSNII